MRGGLMVTTASRFLTIVHTWRPRLGLPVFPCSGKIPAISKDEGGQGCIDATADPNVIDSWAHKFPNGNAGFTFRDGGPLIGIDIDHDKMWWWDLRQREHGLIETFIVKTPHGGYHAYFQRPAGVKVPNIPKTAIGGFECKSDNQYLMAPGSIIWDEETGRESAYEVVMDIDPQRLPDWLLSEIMHNAGNDNQGSGHKQSTPRTGPIYEGEGRNTACAVEYGRLIRFYKDETIAQRMLRAYNETVCKPPLEDDELRKTIFKSGPKWVEKALAEAARSADRANLTDAGNALRLIRAHGQDMHYSRKEKDWYTWQGKYWQRGVDRVYDFAKDVPRIILAEAAAEENDDARKKLTDHALKTESMQKINSMIEYASSDELIRSNPEDYDRDEYLLNVKNGTIDLRTGELKPHDRRDLITRIIPINYNPTADRTKWDSVLERLIPDTDTRRFFQDGIGYSASGSQKEKAFFLVLGPTDTGKSTLFGVIRDILGPYAAECDPEIFMTKTFGGEGNGPNEAVANLRGIRFLTCTEIKNNRALNTEFIKRATGTESLESNRKHEHVFRFKPHFKIWLSGNQAPRIPETNSAIWNRVHEMLMSVSIPKEEQDKSLHDILVREHAEAILAWIIDGAIMVYANGLVDSSESADAKASYKAEQDILANFLTDCTVKNDAGAVFLKDLFNHYTAWVTENTEKGTEALGKIAFSKALSERGHKIDRGTGNKTIVHGLGLLDLEELAKANKGVKS